MGKLHAPANQQVLKNPGRFILQTQRKQTPEKKKKNKNENLMNKKKGREGFGLLICTENYFLSKSVMNPPCHFK